MDYVAVYKVMTKQAKINWGNLWYAIRRPAKYRDFTKFHQDNINESKQQMTSLWDGSNLDAVHGSYEPGRQNGAFKPDTPDDLQKSKINNAVYNDLWPEYKQELDERENTLKQHKILY